MIQGLTIMIKDFITPKSYFVRLSFQIGLVKPFLAMFQTKKF